MTARDKCVALNDTGRRCRRVATEAHGYHGDPEIYRSGSRPTWVEVQLCTKHAWSMGRVNFRRQVFRGRP